MRNAPRGNGALAKTAGQASNASVAPATHETPQRRWCRYCDAYRLKLGRAERRKLARLARPGESVPQWLTAHRDNCPASTQLNTPGWHAAGRVRSPFKAVDRG